MLAIPVLAIVPAAAVPLDAEACTHLQSQQDTLRSEGATADMARGPEWARANLPLERLQRIGTLLQVEEQLNFRCGLARITLPTTIEGGEEEIPGAGEATIEGTGNSIALPQRPPGRPAAAAAAVTTVPKAAAPKAPAAKAPATKPAAQKQPVKAPSPKKAPEKAVQPAAEGAQPKKKAPAQNQNKSQKKQPQADDAYRPPRPITSEGNWAPVVRQ
jgi:hypothetical protein